MTKGYVGGLRPCPVPFWSQIPNDQDVVAKTKTTKKKAAKNVEERPASDADVPPKVAKRDKPFAGRHFVAFVVTCGRDLILDVTYITLLSKTAPFQFYLHVHFLSNGSNNLFLENL